MLFLVLLVLAWLPPATPAPRAQDPGSDLDPAAILAAHVQAVGGEQSLASLGGVLIRGDYEAIAARVELAVLVRPEPFAVREEVSLDGRLYEVLVTDLRRAWRLDPTTEPPPAGATGEPLPFDRMMPLVERALVWKLLLAPHDLAQGAAVGPAFTLPEAPFFHDDFSEGRTARVLTVHGPLHTTLDTWFDAELGRWLGFQMALSDGPHRTRVGRWRTFSGLTLPTAFLAFTTQGLSDVLLVEDVQTGLALDDALFGGDPQPIPEDVRDAAALVVVPSELPGSAQILARDVRLPRLAPVTALLDTGTDGVAIDRHLVAHLELPFLTPAIFGVLAGHVATARHWLPELRLGPERLVQVPVLAHPLPVLIDADERPALIIGMDLLEGRSPVLDLRRDRLLLRGRQARPLQELSAEGDLGEPVAHLPLAPHAPRTTLRDVPIQVAGRSTSALLDTGSACLLRLSARSLQHLGLPTEAAHWEAQGDTPYPLFGAGGPPLPHLLVRFPEVTLQATDARDGAPVQIVYERPWVLVSTQAPEDERPGLDAILGAAALMPFARVGLDHRHERLELQPGADVQVVGEPGEDGHVQRHWRIAAPGQHVGLVLARPREPHGPAGVPVVHEVRPGTPADRAGLRKGDRLLALDGESCHGRWPADLYPRLWPDEGTTVRLSVLRGVDDELVFVLP